MWAAREQDGTLWLYDEMPYLENGCFIASKDNRFSHRIPFTEVLPDVTFENSPVRIIPFGKRRIPGEVKAKIIRTGEIVDIRIMGFDTTDPMKCVVEDVETGERYYLHEVEVLDKKNVKEKSLPEPPFTDNMAHQYAGMALQGLLSNPNFLMKAIEKGNNHDEVYENVARHARNFAEYLVCEMNAED